jgi:mannose-6-phosphate isomerase-like protein (cupin superfamily)
MAASERAILQKYFKKSVMTNKTPHPEVTAPRLGLHSDEKYGGRHFSMSWWAITKPFKMVTECHAHDFDQFLIFVGGDLTNMPDLGGVVELTLSRDGKKLEKFVITEACTVYVPAGLYHCPLNFKKVNNPKKPILFHDLFFSPEYKRK